MRILRRRSNNDGDTREFCPICSEPVPEGATECTMCGSVLRLRSANEKVRGAQPVGAEQPRR
jgi:hypothetical protein